MKCPMWESWQGFWVPALNVVQLPALLNRIPCGKFNRATLRAGPRFF